MSFIIVILINLFIIKFSIPEIEKKIKENSLYLNKKNTLTNKNIIYFLFNLLLLVAITKNPFDLKIMTINILMSSIWIIILLSLYIIDKETLLLPDRLTYPLLLSGIGLHILQSKINFYLLTCIFLLIITGYIIHFLNSHVLKRITIGFGDFKLLAAICAWLGIEKTLIIFLLSNLLLLLIHFYFKKQKIYAFGPFIIFTTLFIWVTS